MKLGFSTGPLGATGLGIGDRISLAKDMGIKVLELGYNKTDRFFTDPVSEIDIDLLDKFDWVSLHAPGSSFNWGDNPETQKVLGIIENFHKKRPLDLVVFHPDPFKDFSILEGYTYPIGIENMDEQKASFQTPDTLRPIFDEHKDWKFVLDLNHCFVNDKTSQLARSFVEAFSDRLTEIHISGFSERHDPLYETQQDQIIKAVPFGDLPVIIESTLPNLEAVKKEYDYILSRVN